MKAWSSRFKIALLSAGLSGSVLVIFGVMVWVLAYNLRRESLDREIRMLGARYMSIFMGRGGREHAVESIARALGEGYPHRIIALLREDGGRTLYMSPNWPEALAPETDVEKKASPSTNTVHENRVVAAPIMADEKGLGRGGRGRGLGWGRGGTPVGATPSVVFFSTHAADVLWRLGVMKGNGMSLMLGLDQGGMEREFARLRKIYLMILPAVLFLVGLGGWVVAGRALRPLKVIAETAERVTVRGLDQRIPETGGSPEAGRLVHVLNRMMDRLEASFHQAIRFSADASHELKTPLTVMQGELENALQTTAPEAPEQSLYVRLLEEVHRLKSITRGLLLLAQADAGRLNLMRKQMNLCVELENMLEDARVLAADTELAIEAQMPPHMLVAADRELLRMAIFNLLTNAVKYNQPGGVVRVTLTEAGGRAVLTVCNTGPGIPPEEQGCVFDRFYRVNRTSAVDGLGLGLSLAREIARAHGGDLALRESKNGYTCFELRIG